MSKKKETVLSILKDVRALLERSCKPHVILSLPNLRVINGRFTDNGDGTICDKQLNVTWIKDPSKIPDFEKELTYAEAEKACAGLCFAGVTGWRMPTVEELRSIIDYTRHDPAWDTNVFGGKHDDWYWTSTPCAWDTGAAWCVSSRGGSVGDDGRDGDLYVRPVRSSQCQFDPLLVR